MLDLPITQCYGKDNDTPMVHLVVDYLEEKLEQYLKLLM